VMIKVFGHLSYTLRTMSLKELQILQVGCLAKLNRQTRKYKHLNKAKFVLVYKSHSKIKVN